MLMRLGAPLMIAAGALWVAMIAVRFAAIASMRGAFIVLLVCILLGVFRLAFYLHFGDAPALC